MFAPSSAPPKKNVAVALARIVSPLRYDARSVSISTWNSGLRNAATVNEFDAKAYSLIPPLPLFAGYVMVR